MSRAIPAALVALLLVVAGAVQAAGLRVATAFDPQTHAPVISTMADQRDAVAGLHAALDEMARKASRQRDEIAVAQASAVRRGDRRGRRGRPDRRS